MNKIIFIPIFWGILDLLSVGWYAGMNIYKGQIPLVHDILSGRHNIESFGLPNFSFLIYIAAILYVSPIFSGILLILKKKSGLMLSYIQTPFRLILIIPPSIFFILWPIDSSIEKPMVLGLGFALIILSETIKVSTLMLWNKRKSHVEQII